MSFDVNHWIRHELGYQSHREDFGEICKYANNLINKVGLDTERAKEILNEDYGAPLDPLTMEDPNKKHMKVYGEDIIEQSAIDQLRTALSLPVAHSGALMPDGHQGYALPIGGVLALENAVSPHFIGFDISCMMMMTILSISVEDFMKHREFLANTLDEGTSFGLGADYTKFVSKERADHEVMEDDRWKIHKVAKYKDKAWNQLGSSGGSNHFADLMIGQAERDFFVPHRSFKKGDRFVALLTHSGSRGVGHKLATTYSSLAKDYTNRIAKGVPNGYEWLDMNTELGQEYWQIMHLMGEYAKANHQVIHERFMMASNIFPISRIWNRHNFAWKEEHFGKELYVHRKGATPSDKDELGLIPASMATPSRLVEGLGCEESLKSSSHGAGRFMSRTQFKDEEFDKDSHDKTVQELDIITKGVEADESYQAYKNIEDVMNYQEGSIVNTLAKLYPKVVIMGGKSDDGD